MPPSYCKPPRFAVGCALAVLADVVLNRSLRDDLELPDYAM